MKSEQQEITCIVCPLGCSILVKKKGDNVEVEGNKCKRGREYARSEALDPRRVLTTSVLVCNGEWPLVSVKTTKPVPKDQLFVVLHEIRRVKIDAPVSCGQVLIRDVADSGIDVVATKTVRKIE